MSRNSFFSLVYLSIASAILLSDMMGYREIRFLFKPLIMIWLTSWSLFSHDKRVVEKKSVFCLGMIFACVGDILLMVEGYFLPGLGAFLVMQLLYISTFKKEAVVRWKDKMTWFKVLGFAVILFAILCLLVPHLSDPSLRIAVPVYAFTISLMGLTASLRDAGVSRLSYLWVLTGAVLFMVSDTLIALNEFVRPVTNEHFWIMSTYMAAQYSIVKGMLKTG